MKEVLINKIENLSKEIMVLEKKINDYYSSRDNLANKIKDITNKLQNIENELSLLDKDLKRQKKFTKISALIGIISIPITTLGLFLANAVPLIICTLEVTLISSVIIEYIINKKRLKDIEMIHNDRTKILLSDKYALEDQKKEYENEYIMSYSKENNNEYLSMVNNLSEKKAELYSTKTLLSNGNYDLNSGISKTTHYDSKTLKKK